MISLTAKFAGPTTAPAAAARTTVSARVASAAGARSSVRAATPDAAGGRTSVLRRAFACGALALVLNALLVYGAFEGTARVQPVRAWQHASQVAQSQARLALDTQHRIGPAALVQ